MNVENNSILIFSFQKIFLTELKSVWLSSKLQNHYLANHTVIYLISVSTEWRNFSQGVYSPKTFL